MNGYIVCTSPRHTHIYTHTSTRCRHIYKCYFKYVYTLVKSCELFVDVLLRYSDFIVNEVDHDGNVIRLTSLDAPLEVITKI